MREREADLNTNLGSVNLSRDSSADALCLFRPWDLMENWKDLTCRTKSD